ncbi:amidohydrolase family protein [Glutamicibacter creatinolyticus]|uniref:amidohydrolase family protein n=1 Tax=Glutamicibacter creatinolyticus TaxID=162496 RepID=UPI0033F0F6F7
MLNRLNLKEDNVLVLKNAQIIIGDGLTKPFSGSIAIEDGIIAGVTPGNLGGGVGDTVIDLAGRLVVPGAINPHAHATAPGPRFASGTPGVSLSESLGNLRRHLSQGHTTVVDLDGFKLPEENAQVRGVQPVKVEMSTVHFEPMFEAADAADGMGLNEAHRTATAHQLNDQGAVVIGEVGAGMTLGGGGQDYLYIPAAFEEATGVRLTTGQAQALKYAVLGRYIKRGKTDRNKVAELIQEYGLAPLTVDGAVELIEQSVLPSFQVALDGLVSSASLAVELGLPTLVHNSAPSDDATRAAAEVAENLFIGGHTNHITFTPEESIESAKFIKKQGGYVEIDTFDLWGRKVLTKDSAHLIAMMQADVVDIIATDYAAGHWDGMWEMVAGIVQVGLSSIEKAVALATGNVAKALPRIGADRGLIKPGLIADLVVTSPKTLADIELVLINGEIAFTGTSGGPLPMSQLAAAEAILK